MGKKDESQKFLLRCKSKNKTSVLKKYSNKKKLKPFKTIKNQKQN